MATKHSISWLMGTSLAMMTLAVGCSGRQGQPIPLATQAPHLSPPTLSFVDIRGGKPPGRSIIAKLELKNPHDHPVWYVFPYWADESLQDTGGRITRLGVHEHLLEGKGYDAAKLGGNGRVVFVVDVGVFWALHLPAGGSIRFDGFEIESTEPVDAVEVWEVNELNVNGQTPVEQWLPYDTMSDADAHISGDKAGFDWENLDWDTKTYARRSDLRKAPVQFIEGTVLSKWNVPVTGLDRVKNQKPWG